MKETGYYSKIKKRYFYRANKEQYDVLTKNHFQAAKMAEEEIKKVTFSYDELFRE